MQLAIRCKNTAGMAKLTKRKEEQFAPATNTQQELVDDFPQLRPSVVDAPSRLNGAIPFDVEEEPLPTTVPDITESANLVIENDIPDDAQRQTTSAAPIQDPENTTTSTEPSDAP